jgi:cystathionine beta-lyase/cystathionine gamma-synthase
MHDGDDEKMAYSRESLAAQAMGKVDAETRAVVPPIHISTTFLRDVDNEYSSGFAYGRADNATVRELENVLQMLEGGASALAFGSGMSAAIAVFLSQRHVLGVAALAADGRIRSAWTARPFHRHGGPRRRPRGGRFRLRSDLGGVSV